MHDSSPDPTQDSTVLDSEVISELRDVMGQDFSVLVDSYQRDGETRLAAVHEALAAADCDTVRRQAHSFKGSSGNLGAMRVYALCLQLESLAVAGDLNRIATALVGLEQEFQEACSALRGY